MLPEQFCMRMKEMLGEEYAAFYASYDLPKYQALRINPLKTERDTFFSAGAVFFKQSAVDNEWLLLQWE